MLRNRNYGMAYVILGILLTNFSYLADVIWMSHDGFIFVGPKAIAGILSGTALILLGAFVLMRAEPGRNIAEAK